MKAKLLLSIMALGLAVSGYAFAQNDAQPEEGGGHFALLDANQDGKLSPEEVTGLQGIGDDAFSKHDIDGNGSLQPSELAAALEQ